MAAKSHGTSAYAPENTMTGGHAMNQYQRL